MTQEISIVGLVLHASIIVQIVIGILLLLSIMSWSTIINKWLSFRSTRRSIAQFSRQYSSNSNIATLFASIGGKSRHYALEFMFFNGVSEYNRLKKHGIDNNKLIIENIERALNASFDAEIDRIESGLGMLASFGSVSPYIGLLGTVWGIMHAFIGLGAANQATLASVAPGIAEALVATAIGLFVAIPAYMFYNKFSSDIQSITNQMNQFGDGFINLISRRIGIDERTYEI